MTLFSVEVTGLPLRACANTHVHVFIDSVRGCSRHGQRNGGEVLLGAVVGVCVHCVRVSVCLSNMSTRSVSLDDQVHFTLHP